MSTKVELQYRKRFANPFYSLPYGWREDPIKKSVPFYRSRRGTYTHRIRSGTVKVREGRETVASFHMWCGQLGFIGDKHGGEIMDDVPATAIICATCEGRAIGSGMLGTPMICGRIVKYSPQL